ncbi:hypothetical protein AOQ84DRAFT_291478, partial [Glonium stellatum]
PEKIDRETWQAAVEFIRTYAYLIKYKIDFQKTQRDELRLVSMHDDKLRSHTRDLHSSLRHLRGLTMMRLALLNWFARFLMGRLTYHHIHAQFNDYLDRFFTLSLPVFLLLTTALTNMQVELVVQRVFQGSGSWDAYCQVPRWVSVLVLMLVVIVSALLVFMMLFCLYKISSLH